MRLIERLKRLESAVHERIKNLIVGNDDGFITAVVGADHVEQYRNSSGGFDAVKALSDTAVADWRDYELCPTDSPETDEE